MEHIIKKINDLARYHDEVSPELIKAKDIKLGLRNADGTGVVVGITSKGTVFGFKRIPAEDGRGTIVQPAAGRLLYCGYDAIELARRIHGEYRYGYDEVCYLLLTGELPTEVDLNNFSSLVARNRALNKSERSIIMQEAQNENQMFALHSVM
nr:citrate/2-methylcitrate synthase [Deltaproteobacteria bacterium]